MLPVLASFSIDVSSLITNAENIFNALWPAFAVLAGLALGFIIIRLVMTAINKGFGGTR
jgi:hypothetical protein